MLLRLPLRADPSTFEPALLLAKYHDNTSQRWWRRLLTKRTVGRWRQRPPRPSTASCRIHAAGPRTKEPGKELLSSIYRMARQKLFRFVKKKTFIGTCTVKSSEDFEKVTSFSLTKMTAKKRHKWSKIGFWCFLMMCLQNLWLLKASNPGGAH